MNTEEVKAKLAELRASRNIKSIDELEITVPGKNMWLYSLWGDIYAGKHPP